MTTPLETGRPPPHARTHTHAHKPPAHQSEHSIPCPLRVLSAPFSCIPPRTLMGWTGRSHPSLPCTSPVGKHAILCAQLLQLGVELGVCVAQHTSHLLQLVPVERRAGSGRQVCDEERDLFMRTARQMEGSGRLSGTAAGALGLAQVQAPPDARLVMPKVAAGGAHEALKAGKGQGIVLKQLHKDGG